MIGVDIGGTNLLVGIVEHGVVIERTHEPITATGDFEKVASQVCDAIQKIAGDSIDSVGISVAGSVDASAGIVLRAQNLDWDNAPLAEVISNKLGCSVTIENDVTAAAWGEFMFGAGVGTTSMFAVWIGTGIGGGLILDKKLWRGPLGTGGEFGMGISEQNPHAEFRELEALASRSGFQRLLRDASLDTSSLIERYGNNEELTQIVNDGASRIGTSIANTITLLSLDTVVLGGGLVESLGESFIATIREQFERDVFPKHCLQCKFKITTLGPDAGLLGVAALSTQNERA